MRHPHQVAARLRAETICAEQQHRSVQLHSLVLPRFRPAPLSASPLALLPPTLAPRVMTCALADPSPPPSLSWGVPEAAPKCARLAGMQNAGSRRELSICAEQQHRSVQLHSLVPPRLRPAPLSASPPALLPPTLAPRVMTCALDDPSPPPSLSWGAPEAAPKQCAGAAGRIRIAGGPQRDLLLHCPGLAELLLQFPFLYLFGLCRRQTGYPAASRAAQGPTAVPAEHALNQRCRSALNFSRVAVFMLQCTTTVSGGRYGDSALRWIRRAYLGHVTAHIWILRKLIKEPG